MAKPPFRAEHVGSLLRPKELTAAFRQHNAGEIDDDAFAQIQDTAISDDHEIGAVGYFSATGNMSLGMPAEDSRSEESEGGLIGRILDAAVGDNGAPRFDTFASFEEGFERLLEVFFGAHQMLPVQRVMFDGAATTCRSGAKDTGLHVVGPYGCAAGLR